MTTTATPIRDFIYLDVDRLYSLYSQAFQGVADRIVQSYIDRLTSTDTQKGGAFAGSIAEAQTEETSRRTESKVLHDHMYNQLEVRLGGAIASPNGLDASNYRTKLQDEFLIKVNGQVEIEDYERFEQFTLKFNQFCEAIAYATSISKPVQNVVDEATAEVNLIKDRNARVKAQERLKHLNNPKTLAKTMGLSQDEKMLEHLRLWSKMFRPDGFDITIKPDVVSDDVAFRGVVDKSWLRMHPNVLRMTYGGAVLSKWTMVGQITYLPGDAVLVEQILKANSPAQPEDPNNPSMRDPFRNMFTTSRTLERMFFESRSRLEIIVCPLAIYRERSVLLNAI